MYPLAYMYIQCIVPVLFPVNYINVYMYVEVEPKAEVTICLVFNSPS